MVEERKIASTSPGEASEAPNMVHNDTLTSVQIDGDTGTSRDSTWNFNGHQFYESLRPDSSANSWPEDTPTSLNNFEDSRRIELKYSQIKSNFAELADYVLLFLYISDVAEPDFDFKSDSFTFKFKSTNLFGPSDVATTAANCYVLNWSLDEKIVPEKCFFKVNRKCVEIHLHKSKSVLWRTSHASISASVEPKASVVNAVVEYKPNTWTPCTPAKEEPVRLSEVCHEPDQPEYYGNTGLSNLGNTCYMNSVIQCISHTQPLRDYILSGEYIKCIGDARIFSSGGRITRALAEVLENLWSGKLPSYCPSQFKSVMCDKFNMFSGCEQHDAHEFLSMLIDALQQELTHCKQKPQLSNEEDNIFKVDPTLPETEQQQRFSEFVTEKADEKWKQFLTGNNSIVTKLFFGQYLSQLSCPDCLKKKVNFETFNHMLLSIPPSKTKYEILFFACHSNSSMCKEVTKYRIYLSHRATVSELLSNLSWHTHVSPKNMRLIEQTDPTQLPKFLNSNWLLSDYQNMNEDSSCSRKPQQPLFLLFEINGDECEDFMELCILQRQIQNTFTANELESLSATSLAYSAQPIAFPFVISVRKCQASFSHISEVLCSYARFAMKYLNSSIVGGVDFPLDEFFPPSSEYDPCRPLPHLIYYKSAPLANSSDISAPFVLRALYSNQNSTENINLITPEQISPTDSEQSEPVFLNDKPLNFDTTFYIELLWFNRLAINLEAKNFSRFCNEMPVVDITVEREITLDDCLKSYFQSESLDLGERWKCPDCKEKRECTINSSIWRLPPCLVVHFKRFRLYSRPVKVNEFIKYPVNNLDLSEFVSSYDGQHCSKAPIYDLYAVINHYGSVSVGHYSAYAYCDELGWREFDDRAVTEVDEDSVVSQNAYLLFYKRRE